MQNLYEKAMEARNMGRMKKRRLPCYILLHRLNKAIRKAQAARAEGEREE